MGVLRKYVNAKGFYVKHAFRVNRTLLSITYQVTEDAESEFERRGLSDGDQIPSGLLHEMISDGRLYTGDSGATEQDIVDSIDDDDNPLQKLSIETKHWIGMRLAHHPSVKLLEQLEIPGGHEIHVTGVPENFIEQLIRVGRMIDGSQFIHNLDMSYNNEHTLKRKQR